MKPGDEVYAVGDKDPVRGTLKRKLSTGPAGTLWAIEWEIEGGTVEGKLADSALARWPPPAS